MTTKRTAQTLIIAIVAIGSLIMGGLHFFAETGQFSPTAATGDASKSDQRPAEYRR